jgi:hypothetical protein
MPRTSTFVLTAAALLCFGIVNAETMTPIVPNDVGHWLNLEYRAGRLAPEIADNPLLVRTLLVVERSLATIDAHFADRRGSPGCQGLRLPYGRLTSETTSTTDASGRITVSVRRVQIRETLDVRVCSSVDQRVVLWDVDGALMILARLRNELGDYPRTLYGLYQVSADEREKWMQRAVRDAARGKATKAPRVVTLYLPPGDAQVVRVDEPKLAAFGAEFALPPTMADAMSSQNPVANRLPDPPRRDH